MPNNELYARHKFNEFDEDLRRRGYLCTKLIDEREMPSEVKRLEGRDSLLIPAHNVLGPNFQGQYAIYLPKPKEEEPLSSCCSTDDRMWPVGRKKPHSGGW